MAAWACVFLLAPARHLQALVWCWLGATVHTATRLGELTLTTRCASR